MAKLFRYELRRLVFSRFFLGLLTVLLWYGWQLLNTVTILGVAYTAPFSPWSFGAYLAGLGPFLSAALLFFLWNQRGEKARGVALLTAAMRGSRRAGERRLIQSPRPSGKISGGSRAAAAGAASAA